LRQVGLLAQSLPCRRSGVFACVHVYMLYVCVYMCMYVFVRTCIYVCIAFSVYVCLYVCMYIHVYMCVCAYLCMDCESQHQYFYVLNGVIEARVCSCAYICMCICVCVYIFVHFFAVSVACNLEKVFRAPVHVQVHTLLRCIFDINAHICEHTRCRVFTNVYVHIYVYMHAYVYGYVCASMILLDTLRRQC